MMKKILALIVFVTSVMQAQYSVKGAMTPPEKGDWVILYKIQGTKQKFIGNTTVTLEDIELGGKKQKLARFEFTLPKDAEPGAYRATYRNEGAGFIDFLFNKEDVEMVFNPQYPDQSVVFTKSLENKVYREYLEATALVQTNIDKIQEKYISGEQSRSNKKAYKKTIKELEDLQEMYEGKSKGMLVNTFIKASEPVNPKSIQDTPKEQLDAIVDGFFNNIDFDSKKLYNSSFLVDKVTDYIFYLRRADDQPTQQKIYKESVDNVMDKISNNNLKKEILEYLVTRFVGAPGGERNSELVDYIFANFYDKLPEDLRDAKFKEEKLSLLTASVGRIAPDFSWKEEGKEYKLSTLDDGEDYLLIFWSTQCSHCVKEIPEVYKFMKTQKETSVVAFAVEMDDIDYTSWAKNKLYDWHNLMGTHPEYKWDNEVVKKYNLLGTPSYFILDKNKKIIAMPNDLKQLEQYYKSKEK